MPLKLFILIIFGSQRFYNLRKFIRINLNITLCSVLIKRNGKNYKAYFWLDQITTILRILYENGIGGLADLNFRTILKIGGSII